MTETLKFATAVVYADDVPATVASYRRVTGPEPTYYDPDLGFALLGEDQAVAIASHDAGMLMLADGYSRGGVSATAPASTSTWNAMATSRVQNASSVPQTRLLRAWPHGAFSKSIWISQVVSVSTSVTTALCRKW